MPDKAGLASVEEARVEFWNFNFTKRQARSEEVMNKTE